MRVLRTSADLRAWRSAVPTGKTVGFVPTMGALHAGHMKLVEESRKGNEVSVVSIFVNPLQFGPQEDLARYPKPFEKDRELCEQAGVDAIFAPAAEEFYAKSHSTFCEVEGLEKHLCGATRPGHFRGVCTVVLKLFNLVQPHRAYFGKKDIQQALILKKMVSDLSLNLEMVLVDTIRELSGLAFSSRNTFLTADEKMRAAALYRGLSRAQHAYAQGEKTAGKLKEILRKEISASQPTRVDYIEIVSQEKLEPVVLLDKPAVMAVAVYYGGTRLIDNLLLP